MEAALMISTITLKLKYFLKLIQSIPLNARVIYDDEIIMTIIFTFAFNIDFKIRERIKAM
jgi:hypothetical protein